MLGGVVQNIHFMRGFSIFYCRIQFIGIVLSLVCTQELNTIQKQFYEWKWTREARSIMFLGHKAIMDSPFFKEQGPDVKAYVC